MDEKLGEGGIYMGGRERGDSWQGNCVNIKKIQVERHDWVASVEGVFARL